MAEIEVTDDITALYAARQWALDHGHQQPDDRMLHAYGAALLAIVARDCCLKPRDHVFHPLRRKAGDAS